jgi:CheY-like chemotaxis protein
MKIGHNSRLVAIVDDDGSVQSALRDLIESDGLPAICFGSAEQFLDSEARSKAACLIADIRMSGMSGLELQAKLKAERCRIPFFSERSVPVDIHCGLGELCLSLRPFLKSAVCLIWARCS